MRTSESATLPVAACPRGFDARACAIQLRPHQIVLTRDPVRNSQARDRARVDCVRNRGRISINQDLLMTRPEVEVAVIAMPSPNVEGVYLGIDQVEFQLTTVFEKLRSDELDEQTGAEGAESFVHDNPKAVKPMPAGKQIGDGRLVST